MRTARYLFILAALLLSMPLFSESNNKDTTEQRTALATIRLNEGLTDRDFSAVIAALSEADPLTYNRSNLISNEACYQQILPRALKLVERSGVYVGVGPEQNFTYIAKFRPRMAFIVDIRRGNMLQILMYKAIFEQAATPVEFLQLLFARSEKTISELLEAPEGVPDFKRLHSNLAYILKNIEGRGIPLSHTDRTKIGEIYSEFVRCGGHIFSDTPPMQPTLRELVYERDASGARGNFLLSPDDYNFVRTMHQKNLIIPLVGNFGGTKTIRGLGKWLTNQNLRVNVFYVSSVEFHIYSKSQLWKNWLANFDSLPWEKNSIVIRTVPYKSNHGGNPESRDDYEWMTLVQRSSGYTRLLSNPQSPVDFARLYVPLRK